MKTKHLINETHCCPVITSAHRFSRNQISCSHRSRVSAVSRLSRCSRGGSEERPGREFVPQLRAGWGFFCCFFCGRDRHGSFFRALFNCPCARVKAWQLRTSHEEYHRPGPWWTFHVLTPILHALGWGTLWGVLLSRGIPRGCQGATTHRPWWGVAGGGGEGGGKGKEMEGGRWRRPHQVEEKGSGWGGRWKRNKIKDKIK